MSHVSFESGKMKLNFSKNFSLVSLIKVTEQKRSGRKVIFEIGDVSSPLKITFGLDEQDNLNLWAKDTKNNNYSIGPIDKNIFSDRWGLFVIEAKKDENTGLTKFSITVLVTKDNRITLTEVSEADVGEEIAVDFVIGATLKHTDNAAFTMANLAIYNKIFTKNEMEAVFERMIGEGVQNE
jgi:hypothetical protein